MPQDGLTYDELREAWPLLDDADRREGFSLLSRVDAEELFNDLEAREQFDLLLTLPPAERRMWLRFLDPDDAADVIQEAGAEQRDALLELLDAPKRSEINALLAYEEDEAGGLMNPRYARLRPDVTAAEAIGYLRRQPREQMEVIYYAYVLDAQQRLLGVVSLRELVTSEPHKRVSELMHTGLVTVSEEMDQEEVSRVFAREDLNAIPVVDAEGHMKGIVTVDDIVDVVVEEATEDIQKIGGTAALDAPYLQVSFRELLSKRVGWLALLLLLGLGAVFVMLEFQNEISAVAALSIFVPMIISSGGNSGSQASTLVVRAMALGEVGLRDWGRVIQREMVMGLSLGSMLGAVGACIVLVWHFAGHAAGQGGAFGPHFPLIALTIGCSILAVALWGTLIGSMLPFGLRALGMDPASASAPLVATIVDASGLVVYFTIATLFLRGTLL